MEMRVEQLSQRSGESVDTIRYYQSKGLLEPPRRQGRVAWYDDAHLERLARIRSLQQRGFTLATIVRLVNGDLDAADEALLGELSGARRAVGVPPEAPTTDRDPGGPGPDGPATQDGTPPGDGAGLTITELAEETGVPLALLKALEAEGLLIPQRMGGVERYTAEDVSSSRAGLLLLEWGIPLSALLELARRHHEATEKVAHAAVEMFSTHVRGPLRQGRTLGPERLTSPTGGEDPGIDRLLLAYSELLPAVNDLVGHHFTRALVKAALDHVEQVGSDAERQAVWGRVGSDEPTAPGGREAPAAVSSP
ncbi:MAG TPA: MerR family transcriptional regulator [Acidimicrobiales bacterium]|nr:MerR family transcriptional regulator [Acidimicrobiales bacterium]